MPPKRKAPASIGYADSTGSKANKRSATATPSKSKVQTTLTVNGTTERPASSPDQPSEAPERFSPSDTNAPPQQKISNDSRAGDGLGEFDHSRPEEQYGIVQRKYYPAEMSNERCAMYNNNELPRPIEGLESAVEETRSARQKITVGNAVVHWFKRDLRTFDNRALAAASKKAAEKHVPLICLFVVSPQDYEAHLTSPVRVDFELRTLEVLKRDLGEKDIPLYVETQEDRKKIPARILALCEQWGAKHLFCNMEYEVDELRRETKMIQSGLEKGLDVTVLHDDVIVAPGALSTGQGKQYAVYSPWYRSWMAYVHDHPELLAASDRPRQNPLSARKNFKDLFTAPIPDAPANKSLTAEEKTKFEHLWPAGESEALERLEKFLNEKAKKYKDARNFPATTSTACVSVHHSSGTLAARTSVRMAREKNGTKRLDGGDKGIAGWISEVAWRDFYKHVLAHWPYVCMSKPFKYEYTNIEWEYNDAQFKAWCEGRTGFPIVDAAMRQLNHTGYMHNRCRMIVASFIAKDLLLDWRLGEKYFMEHLIDGDFASNNGGWGFAASTGVDPQPYFRIFNPLLQSEKFDPDGEYIRKWVPELRDVKGKAVHDPYGRGEGQKVKKKGYPAPIVDHKVCRERALERYKTGIGRETA